MKLSDKLLYLRKKNGLSQENLAERLDVSRQTISRWEMGTATPDAANLLRISNLFGISVDSLLQDRYEMASGALPLLEPKEESSEEKRRPIERFLFASILMFVGALCFYVSCGIQFTNGSLASGLLTTLCGALLLFRYCKEKFEKV